MKELQLRQIIKEEVKNILNEDSNVSSKNINIAVNVEEIPSSNNKIRAYVIVQNLFPSDIEVKVPAVGKVLSDIKLYSTSTDETEIVKSQNRLEKIRKDIEKEISNNIKGMSIDYQNKVTKIIEKAINIYNK